MQAFFFCLCNLLHRPITGYHNQSSSHVDGVSLINMILTSHCVATGCVAAVLHSIMDGRLRAQRHDNCGGHAEPAEVSTPCELEL